MLAIAPVPAPIELLAPGVVLELLDEPIVLPGVDELELPLGLDEAELLLPGLVLEPYALLDDDGLELEPMLLPDEEPIVPESGAEPMVVLPGLDEALAVLPRLGQGDVLPMLEEPMLPVVEPVLDPMLEPAPVLAPAPVVESLEEVCACTANEATASAALAARTASLWVLVMSEVLWLNHVRTRSRPMPLGLARGVRQQVEGTRPMAMGHGSRPRMTAAMGVPGKNGARQKDRFARG